MGLEVSKAQTIIPPRAMIKTGTYIGNAVDNRNIDIGVNLAAKNNVYIIINGASHQAVNRIEYGQGDLTMYYVAVGDVANMIQGLTATGFEIGSDVVVNTNDELYRYIVHWEEP